MDSGRPVALVAGSAGGIGRCTCRLLADKWSVIAMDRKPSEVDGAESVVIDITCRDAVRNYAAGFIESGRKVDALIFSAAVHSTHPAEFLEDAQIDSVIDTNLSSHIKLIRDFLPAIRDGGSIVGISSIAAAVGVPMSSMYSASKKGLEGFYESLRNELAYRRIRVSVVHPGNVNTGFNETGNTYVPGRHPVVDENYSRVVSKIDSRYGMAPEAVASAVVRVLGKKHPRFCYVAGMNAKKANWAKKLLGRDLAIWLMGKFFGIR